MNLLQSKLPSKSCIAVCPTSHVLFTSPSDHHISSNNFTIFHDSMLCTFSIFYNLIKTEAEICCYDLEGVIESFVFHDIWLGTRYPSVVERVRWLFCLSS
nr:hypothetical protein CFP56_36105 [Quercus suber]